MVPIQFHSGFLSYLTCSSFLCFSNRSHREKCEAWINKTYITSHVDSRINFQINRRTAASVPGIQPS